MTDWLVPLLQFSGTGVVIAVALYIMGRWLLTKITVALNAYVVAYAQETAKIDARIERLEKLAEEQARLTRTVETIKDEISAQAKNRDNRWAFRKDVYVNLITTNHDILKILHTFAYAAKLRADPNAALRQLALKMVEDEQPKLAASLKTFTTYATLAPIATADDVLPLLAAASSQGFQQISFDSPDAAAHIHAQMNVLSDLLKHLQTAGRKDLWGAPEPEARAESTTKG